MGNHLLTSLTAIINSLLDGICHKELVQILFGGCLLEMDKKTGSIQPVVVGYVWRWLTGNCTAIESLADYFNPLQVGVGVGGGIHATRRFVSTMPTDNIVVKLDFSKAFFLGTNASARWSQNCINSVTWLTMITSFSNLTSFAHITRRFSAGSLLFCVAIHPILRSNTFPLTIKFMDDITLGGTRKEVSQDVQLFREEGIKICLSLNETKGEVIAYDHLQPTGSLEGFSIISFENASLLGVPSGPGDALDKTLEVKWSDLCIAISHLKSVAAHDALIFLSKCSQTNVHHEMCTLHQLPPLAYSRLCCGKVSPSSLTPV